MMIMNIYFFFLTGNDPTTNSVVGIEQKLLLMHSEQPNTLTTNAPFILAHDCTS